MSLKGADRFRIEREIADTLQGRIYAGTDLLTNNRVVIKEAWRQLVHSGRSRKGHRVPEDFLKERKLIMTLKSLGDIDDGIVIGIDEWDDEHCYYYAMEYCEGELFDYISKVHTSSDYRKFVDTESKKKQQIPMNKPNKFVISVAKMFKQICLAVQWLHNKGYCHLDLSLENTMISNLKNLNVKVIDFGLTQKFNNNDFRFRGRVGKLQYMCPEAYERQVYDAKAADVYCLGVMLFMMLIGAPPYQAPQSQNAAFNYFVNGRCADVLKHWKRLRLITNDALDLLNNMLRYQNQRATLDIVLSHPFFKNLEEEKQANNAMQIEEKTNDNNNNNLMAPSVDDISQDISQMSIEKTEDKNDNNNNIKQEDNDEQEDIDVMDNNNNNNENKNNNQSRNMYCELLLQQWDLENISTVLHATGWSNPDQWNQLDLNVLKFEIGLEHQQAVMFLQKYNQTLQQQQQQMKQHNPNNRQKNRHNTHTNQYHNDNNNQPNNNQPRQYNHQPNNNNVNNNNNQHPSNQFVNYNHNTQNNTVL